MNNLLQLVNFNTWSRNINGVRKQSCLDHIYLNCIETIVSVNQICPTFVDNLLVHVELNLKDVTPANFVYKRNWKHFDPTVLNQRLHDSLESLYWQNLNVQEHWNVLELESWKMWTIVPR